MTSQSDTKQQSKRIVRQDALSLVILVVQNGFQLCSAHDVLNHCLFAGRVCSCTVGTVTFKRQFQDAGMNSGLIEYNSRSLLRNVDKSWYGCDLSCDAGPSCKQGWKLARRLGDASKHAKSDRKRLPSLPPTAKLLKHKRTFQDLEEEYDCLSVAEGRQMRFYIDTELGHTRTRWFCSGDCGETPCSLQGNSYLDQDFVSRHVRGALPSRTAYNHANAADIRERQAQSNERERLQLAADLHARLQLF
jgi:hypothetical protein